MEKGKDQQREINSIHNVHVHTELCYLLTNILLHISHLEVRRRYHYPQTCLLLHEDGPLEPMLGQVLRRELRAVELYQNFIATGKGGGRREGGRREGGGERMGRIWNYNTQ